MKPNTYKYFEYYQVKDWLKEISEELAKDFQDYFEKVLCKNESIHAIELYEDTSYKDYVLKEETKVLLRSLAHNNKEIKIYYWW